MVAGACNRRYRIEKQPVTGFRATQHQLLQATEHRLLQATQHRLLQATEHRLLQAGAA